jgi:hypothetical protein
MFAGGSFLNAGGVSASRVAKWDGSSWTTLGSGLNNNVQALATDSSGNLYAAGSFTSSGGSLSVNRIARWDGSAWHALGAGMDANANGLTVTPSGELLVVGQFNSPGSGIAIWNGSVWRDGGLKGGRSLESVAASPSGHIAAAHTQAVFSFRSSVANSFFSSAASDVVTGDVHLTVLQSNNDVSYLHWSDATRTWSPAVTIAAGATVSRVETVFHAGTGLGSSLWRGVDGSVYKRDFTGLTGSIAASADRVASGWHGEFMAAVSGNGGLFSLFGRDFNWQMQRTGFTAGSP